MVPPARAGRAFGTFGELLQGVLDENDLDFLVTFPIELWTTAEFRLDQTTDAITVHPAHKVKSVALARALLGCYGIENGGTLVIDSDVPEGKGFASSSADLVATGRAVGAALGVEVPNSTLEEFLRAIEPSDGVMYPGTISFYHRQVRLREHLGYLPRLTIVGIDEGGMVDTVAFNRLPKPFNDSDKREYGRLLDTIAQAVRTCDLATVGEVATRSAMMNQKLSPKQTFDAVRRICRQVGGLGVVQAHSGTILGILLAESDPEHEEKLERAQGSCHALAGNATIYRSLPGPPVPG